MVVGVVVLDLLVPSLDRTFWLPEAEARCLPGSGREVGLRLSFRKPRSSHSLVANVISLEQRPGGRFARHRRKKPKPHCAPQPLDAASHPQPTDVFLGDLARPQPHVTGKGRCEVPAVLKACLMLVFPGKKGTSRSQCLFPLKSLLRVIEILGEVPAPLTQGPEPVPLILGRPCSAGSLAAPSLAHGSQEA